jgi:hypothetical protein
MEGAALRIVCPACGTDQEAASKTDPGTCIICARPLPFPGEVFADVDLTEGTDAAAPPPPPLPARADREESRHARVAEAVAALPQSLGGEDAHFAEIQAGQRRLTTAAALVPLVGLYWIAKSDLYSPREKARLYALAFLMLALIVGPAYYFGVQSSEERSLEVHQKLESQIQALAPLVEDYRKSNGDYPDARAWSDSAGRGDLRFYDPWGRIYEYVLEDSGYSIGTYGADGKMGGSGENRDFFVTFPRAPAPAPTSS